MDDRQHQDRAEKFWREVELYRSTRKGEVLTVIKLKTAEWDSWERYFREYRNFVPVAMQRIIRDQNPEKAMTVPTQWPEWFDAHYAATKAA